MSRKKNTVRKKEMLDYLFENNREDTPDWLKMFKPGDELNLRKVFSTASVMYPGSGNDGRAIKLFSQAHAAHLFYYVDSGMSPNDWKQELKRIPVKGYHILDAREMTRRDLNIDRAPDTSQSSPESRDGDENEFIQHRRQILMDMMNTYNADRPTCYFVIFERDRELDDKHGVERFAVAFVWEDAMFFYERFFCWPWYPAPTWIVIQSDMATWGLFGRGGPLEQRAATIKKFPKYLLVGYNTEAWQNYTAVDNVWPRSKYLPRPWIGSRTSGKSWYLYRRDADPSDAPSGKSEISANKDPSRQ